MSEELIVQILTVFTILVISISVGGCCWNWGYMAGYLKGYAQYLENLKKAEDGDE